MRDEITPGTRHVFADLGMANERLVKAFSRVDRDQGRVAAIRIRELATTLKLGRFDWHEWRSHRDEGRP